MKKNFTGYVLSGGKSARMGADKAFLNIGEKTFLENAVEILAPVCKRVKIVLNKSQTHFVERLPAGISHIFDIHENRGAPGGIHAALYDCETEFAVILAVDLPLVTSEAIRKLANTAFSSTESAAIIPAQNDGRTQPLCGIYRKTHCFPVINRLIIQNDSLSVNNLLGKLKTKVVPQNVLGSDSKLFFNVNTSINYKAINLTETE